MANTYSQIHIQVVFAVHSRKSLISEAWKDDLYKYITGIIQNYDHKLLQINGMADHIHILIGLRPTQAVSDLMKKVKQDSSAWINKNNLLTERFSWQAGYGAFSYAKSQIPTVIKYIKNQEEHHSKRTFTEEYIELLQEFDIKYDERYLFKTVS